MSKRIKEKRESKTIGNEETEKAKNYHDDQFEIPVPGNKLPWDETEATYCLWGFQRQ